MKKVEFKKLKFRFILSYYFCIFLSILLGVKSSDSLSGFFVLKKDNKKKHLKKKFFMGMETFFLD